MDSDLQDPPELIGELVGRWKEGFDVVYAQRKAREGESLFKRASAYVFYRLVRLIATIDVPPDTETSDSCPAGRRMRCEACASEGVFSVVWWCGEASDRPRFSTTGRLDRWARASTDWGQ